MKAVRECTLQRSPSSPVRFIDGAKKQRAALPSRGKRHATRRLHIEAWEYGPA